MSRQLDKYRERFHIAISTAMSDREVHAYTEFCELIAIKERTLSAIINNRQYPTVEQGIDICRKFGFSANWLFLGKGDMRMKTQATLDEILSLLQNK